VVQVDVRDIQALAATLVDQDFLVIADIAAAPDTQDLVVDQGIQVSVEDLGIVDFRVEVDTPVHLVNLVIREFLVIRVRVALQVTPANQALVVILENQG